MRGWESQKAQMRFGVMDTAERSTQIMRGQKAPNGRAETDRHVKSLKGIVWRLKYPVVLPFLSIASPPKALEAKQPTPSRLPSPSLRGKVNSAMAQMHIRWHSVDKRAVIKQTCCGDCNEEGPCCSSPHG